MLFAVGADSQITRLGDACVYPYYVFGSDGDAYASKQREAALVERDEVFLKVLEEMLTALRDNKTPKANVTLEDVAYLKATMDAFQEQNKAQQIQLDVLIRNRMNFQRGAENGTRASEIVDRTAAASAQPTSRTESEYK